MLRILSNRQVTNGLSSIPMTGPTEWEQRLDTLVDFYLCTHAHTTYMYTHAHTYEYINKSNKNRSKHIQSLSEAVDKFITLINT